MAKFTLGNFIHGARQLLGNRLINAANTRVLGKINGGRLRHHHTRAAHMVRGSSAAHAHMAHLRSLRRRR